MSILDDPGAITAFCSFLYAIGPLFTSSPRSIVVLICRFFLFPYYFVVLIHSICFVLRHFRDRRRKRLANTLYHRNHIDQAFRYNSGAELGIIRSDSSVPITTLPTVDRDITSATPSTPGFSQLPFRRPG